MVRNAKTVDKLLKEYKDKGFKYKSEKINFVLGDDRDIYNITKPFKDENDCVIAGRVEKRDSELSDVLFFKESGDKWIPKEGCSSLKLQDPFFTRVNGKLVIGGVEVYNKPNDTKLGYRTVFLKGEKIKDLKRFATGPEMMKDIRLLEIDNEKILVFTRPTGEVGGRGTIGFTIINSLDELNAENLSKAELINNQFIKEEWGGVNELHKLSNGLIGVLGHIAKFDEFGNRHYYSMSFAFNLDTHETTPIKIIATRDDFLEGAYKREDIKDVIFSGGLIRKNDGKAELYCGVSDAEAHKIVIEDPFLEYENLVISKK